MRRLFWKIFGWFWGVMLLLGLSLYFVVLTTPPDPMPRPWRETASQLLASYAAQSAAHWEHGGRASINAYFNFLEQDTQAHFWLYDRNGHELTGRPIPPHIPNSLLLPPPERDPKDWREKRRPIETRTALRDLFRRAARQNSTLFQLEHPRILIGQQVTSATGRHYILVGSIAQPAFARRLASPRRQIIGIIVLVGVSILVCYALTRSITAPIHHLREVTQRLTSGELSARVSPSIKKRRDEIADLSQDFDTMAERIETLLTSQRRLLGDVSHELRSPLARLSMALGLARRHADNGAQQELDAALKRIAREKERLNTLIRQLLELVRLESGENPESRENINLTALVSEVAADADFEARDSQRRVLMKQSEPCFINGSRELLLRAVENVVRNAMAYTEPNTTVEIALTRQDKYAQLLICDHGPGVSQQALEKLFQPFYRVAEARDRQSGGVGLGLAIAERAVRSNGGTIRATNRTGAGLQIEICLPLAD